MKLNENERSYMEYNNTHLCIHTVTEKIQCIKHTLKLLTTLTLSLVVILIVTLSGSPFDCDCLVALLSVTLPGSRVCIVVRWYKKYIIYVSY